MLESPAQGYYGAAPVLEIGERTSEGLRDMISAETLRAINQRARENFQLVGKVVRAGMEAGIYRKGLNPRRVVDVLWSLLMGLVQLVETRRNLGVRADMLPRLHREAFEWIECGLRQGAAGSAAPPGERLGEGQSERGKP